MALRLPLVVILGATGSGKTKLSLELAQKFKGEIISADSMQVYKGLDIITAKATKEEQNVAPHHLIDILEPHETFTVVQYRNSALKIIENLINKNKLPIIVGGTNYYIESLLWKILIEEPGDHVKALPSRHIDHELSSEELHKKLQLLDPAMARRLHPNNKRKILRSLEVLQQKGKPHSQILNEQQGAKGGSATGGPLRFANALILKLECEQETLNERLNNRVDKMMEQGLLQELANFHKLYNENRIKNSEIPDYTKGVFQSIGFKEFHSYLTMSEEEKNSENGQLSLQKCIEDLKLVTRRYARKQNKWTRNRFLGRRDREVPPMYGLDVTNLDKWEENVTKPAIEIIQSFINQSECKYQPLPVEPVATSVPNSEDDTNFCDICERIFVGSLQWREHLRSNRHKKMIERRNRLLKEELKK
ncbi:tRNA dimethylallyltransferase isoform X1 [Tribolium castaneum]|uniref:tRNA dimethylallyltransferase, mitochondrial-like Protein n=1 Tax=Tribolium castaneum TaxID=7070 RepID=D6WDB1_TRICA|nr:PREDICTED: tRNA dimethylallyltransferase, mitochondrial [Tribolium castaneum]EEZ99485.2 tRNA dimethylallyltransferase, mitochondrial-like Protein [Tribolium castaneum]|eukprot:XP_970625.1 PREDICTED: tRNA dimethylallyltransferase, mitochondrial [Tribolium castaneum]